MLYATLGYEYKLWNEGKTLVCGIDEVGRGCFAGPVVAGAVIFSPDSKVPDGIADSKLLKPSKREKLADEIKASALDFAIAEIDVETINEVGIGKATQLAFLNAVNCLKNYPEFFLIDAFHIQGLDKSIQNPIKAGDKLSVSIAAASIIAKVYRDELMSKLDGDFPGYGFARHKGYGTKDHRDAIGKLGLCDLHRKSFTLGKFIGIKVSTKGDPFR